MTNLQSNKINSWLQAEHFCVKYLIKKFRWWWNLCRSVLNTAHDHRFMICVTIFPRPTERVEIVLVTLCWNELSVPERKAELWASWKFRQREDCSYNCPCELSRQYWNGGDLTKIRKEGACCSLIEWMLQWSVGLALQTIGEAQLLSFLEWFRTWVWEVPGMKIVQCYLLDAEVRGMSNNWMDLNWKVKCCTDTKLRLRLSRHIGVDRQCRRARP